MKVRRLICAIAAIGITTVNANCNPLTETCAPIPGITSPIRTDFTKLATEDVPKNGWTIANYATFRSNPKDGGVFPVEKRYDAPYIWTTAYFLYGRADVVMQAAPGAGLISSAVLMSDTADEVDWEWSGNNYWQKYPNVQTNYFGKGITGSYDRSTSVTTKFEMTAELHKYSIIWKAESLTWLIDDVPVRTLWKKDCDNGEHQYPQTPSRFHLGVWAAGDPSNAAGVIQWSGGKTDFSKLPFTAYVQSVNLEPSSKCAYFNYTDKRGSTDSVKCLSELPKSLSSLVSSTALLNTLSAAPPAPSTTSNTVSTSGASSSSSSRATGGSTSTNTASSGSIRTSGSSSSSSRNTGGTTSSNTASSRATQTSGGSESVELTTSTVFKTTVFSTVTSCNTAVTNCPANKPLTSTVLVTDVVVDYTTVCPVSEVTSPSSTQRSPSTGSGSKPASSTAGTQTTPPSTGRSSTSSKVSTSLMNDPIAASSKGTSSSSSKGTTSKGTTSKGTTSKGTTSKGSSTSSSKRPSSSKHASTSTLKASSTKTAQGKGSTIVDPAKRPGSEQPPALASSQTPASSQGGSGTVTGSQSKQDSAPSGNSATGSTEPPELTTSTVYSTNVYTVTSCGADVKSCPARSTVLSTEVVVAYTTVCPVSSESSVPPGSSPAPSSDSPSEPRPSDSAPPQSQTTLTFQAPKDGSQPQPSQTASPGSPSAPQPTDSAPPQSQPLSTIIPPKDGTQQQSSQKASPSNPSAPAPDDSAPPPGSSTIDRPKGGSETQSQKPASSDNPSAPARSSGAPQPSFAIVPPSDEHAATTSMEYGQSSASLYNTDTEVKASGSSTSPAALPTDKKGDAQPVAQNHASPDTGISQAAAEHGSAAPPAEKGHTPGAQSAPGATPAPADGSHVALTTRSTITRTTTVKLTSTRRSTSTVYSESATVVTACAPGKSGADCSTISSTTTFVVSKLVTPVPFTTTNVFATTEVVDVAPADSALASAAAQGASGVAGAGTGTGQHLAGAKTTTPATIAGAGRAFEAVPGVMLALAMAVFFL